ncbi:MAG TPA: hypothetical protein PKV40_08410, partial [Candidatus Kapabacteria bacterium]|nr:hypothetical protein [Candidatus Kapabacteria bacterium]
MIFEFKNRIIHHISNLITIKFIRQIIFFALLFNIYLIIPTATRAQCPDFDTFGNADFFSGPLGEVGPSFGTTQYEYNKVDNTTYDIKILSIDNKFYYEGFYLTDEEFKYMALKTVIHKLVDPNNALEGVNYTFNFYEDKMCSNYERCYLKVDESRHVFCTDEGFNESDITYFLHNDEYYYSVAYSHSCGYGCCKTTYSTTVIRDQSGNKYWHIFNKTYDLFVSCPEENIPNCLVPD